MFQVLKRKVVEDGCSLHFLDTSKMNINKLLRFKCTLDIVTLLYGKITKGLLKLKSLDNHTSSEYM